jgi:hypothetical protein
MPYPRLRLRLSHRGSSKATRNGRLYATVPVTFPEIEMQCEDATADFKIGSDKVARKLPEMEMAP